MTITDIATNKDITPDSARKHVSRTLRRHGHDMPEGLGKTDDLPQWVLELLEKAPVKMNGAVTQPGPAAAKPTPAPVLKPVPTPKPVVVVSEPVQARTSLDRVFGAETNILAALAVLVVVDGISFSRLGTLAFGESGLIQIAFAIVGSVVGYAALQNTYTLSLRARMYDKPWEKENAQKRIGQWVAVFAMAETAIHAVAVGLVGDWVSLAHNKIAGLILICVVVPLAKAGLTVLLFKPK